MCYDSCFVIQKLLNTVSTRFVTCPWLTEVRKFHHSEETEFLPHLSKKMDSVYWHITVKVAGFIDNF